VSGWATITVVERLREAADMIEGDIQ